jgi:hypothetical protein
MAIRVKFPVSDIWVTDDIDMVVCLCVELNE